MAACDVLYYDAADVGRLLRDRFGNPLGRSDGWRPCPAQGHAWIDPDLMLRHVCAAHQRQLTALHTAGMASQVRWTLSGEASREAGA